MFIQGIQQSISTIFIIYHFIFLFLFFEVIKMKLKATKMKMSNIASSVMRKMGVNLEAMKFIKNRMIRRDLCQYQQVELLSQ